MEPYGEAMMRVLVTGATGFIGSHVARKLKEEGFEVAVLARPQSDKRNLEGMEARVCHGDLRDRESLKEALKGCGALFHVAASYSFWSPDPAEFYEVNVKGTANIIEEALSLGCRKIVYTSSESTVAIPKGQKLGTEGAINRPEDVYSHYKRSKVLAEMEVRRLCEKGWPITIVNPTTPIGERDIKPTPTGRIVLDFLNGAMPAYINTGLNVVDVEDVARGHVLALEKGEAGRNYILGNRNMSLAEILELVAGLAKKKAPRFRIPMWAAFSAACADELIRGKILKKCPRIPLAAVNTARKFRYFDTGRARKELGLVPGPIEEAFSKSINWFIREGYVNHR
ncbi:MAG: hopanoid-associated sugar epimerase [Actinomycetota bacterium]